MAGKEHDESLAHRTTEVASGDRSGARGISADSPPDWRPAFDSDTVLGERYRIVRFLARGGMGEVYEAEDLVLHMRVALKSIARELVADAGTLEGLKREVLLARKVTHPSVCRLHDLGFHVSPEGTSAFLTMDSPARRHARGAHRPQGAALDERVAPDRAPARDRARGRTRGGGDSSRLQDAERHARAGEREHSHPRRRHGLRDRSCDRGRGPPRVARRRAFRRDPRVHGPRAGRGRGDHARDRRVCARCGAVRDGDRWASVRG